MKLVVSRAWEAIIVICLEQQVSIPVEMTQARLPVPRDFIVNPVSEISILV